MTTLAPTRARTAAYWTTTAVLATECVLGGILGQLKYFPFLDTAIHLGYPRYFMAILGVWYVSAGLVLLAPRLPRLKEWAYAGLVFNYTGAAASHIWVGDDVRTLVGSVFFLALTAASWALRPPSRRDLRLPARPFSRGRAIVYWVATVSVAAELALGGLWDLARIDYVRDVVEHLGYPAYLLTIMGVWKIPGAAVLLLPHFPRVKEWAYAGAVINYASAVASHLIVGDGVGEIVAPTALLALTVISWALRSVPVSHGDADPDLDLADRDQGRPG
ncbi:DoxX family protein [Mycobacterium sp.]|uniref:DoxX family protein n=1 Tax=Mycobacterium sp. TaxID=1785 RepID=UPI002D96FD8A|nr:DoxX family protein [Mycobacterium sp.]